MSSSAPTVPDQILQTIDYLISRNLRNCSIRIPIAQLPGPLLKPAWRWEDVADVYRGRGWDATYDPDTSELLLTWH